MCQYVGTYVCPRNTSNTPSQTKEQQLNTINQKRTLLPLVGGLYSYRTVSKFASNRPPFDGVGPRRNPVPASAVGGSWGPPHEAMPPVNRGNGDRKDVRACGGWPRGVCCSSPQGSRGQGAKPQRSGLSLPDHRSKSIASPWHASAGA